MGIHRRVDFVLHVAGPPGAIHARRINESNRKFIEVIQGAGDRLTRSRCYRNSGFRVVRVQHLFLELEPLVSRCDSGKVPGWRVASGASPRTVEVLFTGLGVSSLEIGDIHALASAFVPQRVVLLGMDKGHQAGNLLIGVVETWHFRAGASIADNGANLVSTYIGSHQLGSRQIQPTLSTASITAMTKRAISPEQGP